MSHQIDITAQGGPESVKRFHDRLAELEARFEKYQPSVQAFVDEPARFERWKSAAGELIDRAQSGEAMPLFGLSLGVKDIFHVDGLPTRAGSQVPAEVLAGPQASTVTALRQAGMIVLGKTVTTEFAYFGAGPTRNPHNLDHTPGGSSSGSAAAVAAGLSELALGTQTIGSVNRPAAFCGVVGFKPTYDRISRQGVIPLSPSLDHVGLFGRDVAIVATAAPVVIADWQTPSAKLQPRLAVPRGKYLESATESGRAHFEETLDRLQAAGFSVVSTPELDDIDEIWSIHERILAVEAAQVHESWYAEYGDTYHPRTADLIRMGQSLTQSDLQEALTNRERLRQRLTAALHRIDCQLWLSPAATGPAPKGLESTGNPIMNLPWTHAGVPTISLPSGVADGGLPLGLQLTGTANADEMLFEWASAIEAALPPPPRALDS